MAAEDCGYKNLIAEGCRIVYGGGMAILFYGDAHKNFEPLFRAVRQHKPEHVVLLGDLELDRPLREVIAPVLEVSQIWFILGNHDSETPEQYDYLMADYPEGNLSGRAAEMRCREGSVTVAGLSGVYRKKIWFPKDGLAAFHSRGDYMRAAGKRNLWRDGLPLRQRDTIFPEDHDILACLKADILVTHEAPETHVHGFREIGDLARSMGAKRIIHGHHHESYEAETGGIIVNGLAEAGVFMLSPG